jgi:MoaA/NifB/PqqE/SkfB family radical SAM enzyme
MVAACDPLSVAQDKRENRRRMNERLRLNKFERLQWTAKGERRASIALRKLETLWFNTGTLCNITCANCYIESSPRNDRLAYLSLDDVVAYLEEIARDRLPTRLIGFTGGEPFMNAHFPAILKETLSRGAR